MTGQELAALRRRAYGPNADIQFDPSALERLRELEEAIRPQPPARRDPEPVLADEQQVPQQPRVTEEAEREPHEILRRLRVYALLGLRRLARIRRSTVLIVLGVAVTATVVIVALVLVERVQPDPLQVGAEQVARLSIDPSFEAPFLFGGSEDRSAPAFQEFYGLRPVVSEGALIGGVSGDDCLNIISSADLEKATANSFSGLWMSGCGAGGFPAIIQFRADMQEAPEELDSAFPNSAGLQFVYDSAHDEVVVFMTE